MLPSRYRGRYSLIILLSLLVHFTVIVVLFWNSDKQDKQAKTEKTVIVKLKQKEEPKKVEEKKKEEPKKEEPKKEEVKKEEAKKQEAKKQEAKKQEAKKQEAKKQEAKKQEAKKQEAKKQEAKKQEAKKQEAKKQEAKKQEAKKQEAKKQEAKKELTKESPPPYMPYQSSVDVYSQEPQKSESLRKQDELMKYGSMTMLDDREMKRAVIYTIGYGNRFQVRQYEGQIIKESLSDYEKQILNRHLTSEAEYIFSFHKPPKKDGKKYYGEISLLLDSRGNIAEITLKTPSGSDALDESVYNALVKAKKLKLPNDPLIRKAMITAPLTLNYSDEEMVD